MSLLLQAEHLVIGYGGQALCSPLTFKIPVGASIAIIGGNGSGKTTLMKTLLGIVPAHGGRYEWKAGLKFGYVPQENQIDMLFPMSVLDLMKMGILEELPRFRKTNAKAKALIESTLETVGMSEFRHALVRELSGGQRQRVLIARAMLQMPQVLIMDEPFNSLDYLFKEKLWKIFEQWQSHDELSLLVIEHDLNRIINQVDWIIILGPEQSLAGPSHEILTEQNLSKAYGAPVHVHHENNTLQVHFL